MAEKETPKAEEKAAPDAADRDAARVAKAAAEEVALRERLAAKAEASRFVRVKHDD